MLDKKVVNLVGFYEAVPENGQSHSGFTMQVNQVGLLLVGWISQVPNCVTNLTPVKTFPTLPPGERIGYGTFAANLTPSALGRLKTGVYLVDFQWSAYGYHNEPFNPFDPHTTDKAAAKMVRGTLRLEYVADPDYAYLGVRAKALGLFENKSWQITGINFEGAPYKGFDAVRLVKRKIRLPYDIIEQVGLQSASTTAVGTPSSGDILRQALIAAHICVVPESHLLKILRMGTKLFIYGPAGQEADTPPETEKGLNDWLKATTPATRRLARTAVLSTLNAMHVEIARLPFAYHRESVRDLFIDNARKIFKGEETYYDLYVQILDEEFREHPASAVSFLQPTLRWGTFPTVSNDSQSFRYTITLLPVPYLDLPKTGLPINGTMALFNVKCEKVEFELDKDNHKKIDPISGNPVVKKVVEMLYDSEKQTSSMQLVAVTGAFGISPTNVPAAVELFSLNGDLKYEHFRNATFSFVWIQGTPKVKIGPYAELKPLATGFFDITLPEKNNLELWGSVTQLPGLAFKLTDNAKSTFETFSTAPKTVSDVVKKGSFVQPYIKDVVEKGPAAAAESWLDSLRLKNLKEQFKTIFTATMGVGHIISPQSFRTPSTNTFTAPKPTIEDTHTLASSRIMSFFQRDSADFSEIVQSPERDNIVRLLTARDLIEFFLAIHLELVMSPRSTIKLVGHASPEGPVGPLPAGQYDPYNDTLSEARTYAVQYALLDAMEIFPGTAWGTVYLDWQGEKVARDYLTQGGGGLSDPPSTGNTAVFRHWLKTHQAEVEQWPFWRRVDMDVDGIILLRLYD